MPTSTPATESLANPLQFPQSALIGSVGELARSLADGTEVPDEFYFAAGLTLLGNVCGTRLRLNIGFDVEPRLYTILLGESYSVKKSTAMKKAVEFFSNIPLVPAPNVVYGVGSAEGLARELTERHSLLLAYDELRALVDKCQVKGSTLLPIVTSLFEQTKWHNATKSRSGSVTVDDAHLSMLACCTLDTYADIWKRDAIAIGLPNRLFIVNADQKGKVAWPKKPDAVVLEGLRKRVRDQLSVLPKEFDIAQDAMDTWSRWYEAMPRTEHCRRLETIGYRLLMLIALTTDKEVIDVDTVETVTSILDYELRIRTVTDPIDADNHIAKLEEAIRRVLRARGPLPDRPLRQAVHADRVGLWAYQRAKDNLVKVSREIELVRDVFRIRDSQPHAA